MRRLSRHTAVAALGILFLGLLAAEARAQTPGCNDVFPQAITEDASPPEVFDLPSFPGSNDGDANWDNNISLAAGTYYFEDFQVDNDTVVTLTGPVLIFVENDIEIGNNVVINVPGNAADFVLIGYDQMDIGNNSLINGLLYADEEIDLGNNVQIDGAVTGTDDVDTSPNTSVSYNPSAVASANFGGLCTQGGGGGPSGSIFSYFMEEQQWTGAGGEVADSSGNGLDATAVGGADTNDTAPAIPGSPGTCRYGDFSGGSQRVTAAVSSLVNDADSFSIGGWVRLPDAAQTTSTPSIFAYGNTIAGQWPERFEVYMERNQYDAWWSTPNWDNWVLVVRKRNGNLSFMREPVYVTSSNNPLSDVWVHVVATYDATQDEGALFLNGSLVESSNMSGPNQLYDSSGGLGLTAHPGGQYDARGLLDEVHMFGSALDAGEVSALYQNTRPCETGYDHIRLIHPSTGLTCSPSQITVQACADSDCTSLHPDPVDIDFTSPAATWTPDPITFTGSTTVDLQYTTPGFVTLDAAAMDPPAINPTRCFSGGSETNCEMEFLESGFVIDVPDHVADTAVTASIAAVKADPLDPTQCVPGFDNETKDVAFWSDYVNPASGSLAVAVDGSSIATGSPGTTIPIAFDGNGVGSFDLQYPDVGDVNLNARFEGSGDEAGLVMIGEDRFITRPARFTLDIPGNPAATDHTGDVFTGAGSDFEVTVAARNASNGITPNFGNETPAEDVDLELTLVEPSGGVQPGLVGSFDAFGTDCNGNSATAGTACGMFSWPEVGIVSLNPRLASGSYLGTSDVVGTAANHVGRFIPDHFELGSGSIDDRAGVSGCAASPFTYVGERFDALFTLYARNVDGNTTANYEGSFAFLGGADLDLSGTPTLNVDASNISWMLGVGDASAQLSVPRTAPEGPYPSYQVLTAPVDSDGVALSGNDVVATTELRFGRAVIDNAIGSELGPLQLPWRTEYWDGSTWLINIEDDCTTLDPVADIDLSSSGGDTGDGTTAVSLGGGTTSIDAAQSDFTLISGTGSVHFTAPGSPGWVDVLLGLGTNWPYLRDDLDDDGSYQDDPQARASFGLFDGNSQRIYIREIPPQ